MSPRTMTPLAFAFAWAAFDGMLSAESRRSKGHHRNQQRHSGDFPLARHFHTDDDASEPNELKALSSLLGLIRRPFAAWQASGTGRFASRQSSSWSKPQAQKLVSRRGARMGDEFDETAVLPPEGGFGGGFGRLAGPGVHDDDFLEADEDDELLDPDYFLHGDLPTVGEKLVPADLVVSYLAKELPQILTTVPTFFNFADDFQIVDPKGNRATGLFKIRPWFNMIQRLRKFFVVVDEEIVVEPHGNGATLTGMLKIKWRKRHNEKLQYKVITLRPQAEISLNKKNKVQRMELKAFKVNSQNFQYWPGLDWVDADRDDHYENMKLLSKWPADVEEMLERKAQEKQAEIDREVEMEIARMQTTPKPVLAKHRDRPDMEWMYFDSISSACKELRVGHASVKKVLRGSQPSAARWLFRWPDQPEPEILPKPMWEMGDVQPDAEVEAWRATQSRAAAPTMSAEPIAAADVPDRRSAATNVAVGAVAVAATAAALRASITASDGVYSIILNPEDGLDQALGLGLQGLEEVSPPILAASRLLQPVYKTVKTVSRSCTDGTMPEFNYELFQNDCLLLPQRVFWRNVDGKTQRPLFIKQTVVDGKTRWKESTGCSVWHAGIVLQRQIDAMGPQFWRGKKVLELGTGTGIGAITAAANGASVLATDKDLQCVQLAAQNAKTNGVSIDTATFEWGSPLPNRAVAASGVNFGSNLDVVIGADVTYNGKAWPVLAKTLKDLGKPALLSAEERRPSEFRELRSFFEEKGLELEELPNPMPQDGGHASKKISLFWATMAPEAPALEASPPAQGAGISR